MKFQLQDHSLSRRQLHIQMNSFDQGDCLFLTSDSQLGKQQFCPFVQERDSMGRLILQPHKVPKIMLKKLSITENNQQNEIRSLLQDDQVPPFTLPFIKRAPSSISPGSSSTRMSSTAPGANSSLGPPPN